MAMCDTSCEDMSERSIYRVFVRPCSTVIGELRFINRTVTGLPTPLTALFFLRIYMTTTNFHHMISLSFEVFCLLCYNMCVPIKGI